jgi:hypothetical protein
MRNNHLRFFAVWTTHIAYVLDVYPGEIKRYRRELTGHGNHVAGPFDTEDEAYVVARLMHWRASHGQQPAQG